MGEVISQALSADESGAFTAVLRPRFESGRGQERTAVAFLSAAADGRSP